MKKIASTRVQCGAARHQVHLHVDGSVACDCGVEGIERGEAIAAQLMLGAPGGVRGCAGLVALVQGASGLVREARGAKEPTYGVWKPLVECYRSNPIYLAALDLAESTDDKRVALHEQISIALGRVRLDHRLGKRAFAERLRFMWDVPLGELSKFVVASFSDDRWEIPYTPDWTKLHASGESVIDGKFVCGRADDGTVFAITKHPDDEAWWVMPHRLEAGRLVEMAA